MSFQQGLSGLAGASRALDAISNNVANSGTVGFKQSQAQFADVYAASLAGGGAGQIGIGTTIGNVAQQFTQGNITVTNSPLDVAINGAGFFRMSDGGTITYTRNGQFNVDKEGYIVNSAGYRLTGFGADTLGNIIPGSPVDLLVSAADLTPNTTTEALVTVNLDSRQVPPTQAPFLATDPRTYNSSTALTVYDTLGNPHTLSLYFLKDAAANTWDTEYTLDGAAVTPASGGTLTFSNAGALAGGGLVTFTGVVPGTGAANLNFTLDYGGTTQFGSAFGVSSIVQDGYSSGRLAGLSVGADGILQGRYSNGQSRNLGQVVLANFNNPNGLTPLGGNQWGESPDSGQPLVGAPNTGSLGVLQSSAVEESNVDLTAELVAMITQQRAYQANAQSIRTQDAILNTLVNLR